MKTGQKKAMARDEEKARAVQELWFVTLRQSWTSLILVPADENIAVGNIAYDLAEVGKLQQGRNIDVLTPNLESIEASRQLVEILKTARTQNAAGPQLVVALEPVVVRPAGVAAVFAADAVYLCLEKGSTVLKSAKKTIEMLGRDRISGCILLES